MDYYAPRELINGGTIRHKEGGRCLYELHRARVERVKVEKLSKVNFIRGKLTISSRSGNTQLTIKSGTKSTEFIIVSGIATENGLRILGLFPLPLKIPEPSFYFKKGPCE